MDPALSRRNKRIFLKQLEGHRFTDFCSIKIFFKMLLSTEFLCSALFPPLEGGVVPSLGLLRPCALTQAIRTSFLLSHSHKDRPPHTGHLGPWDPTSAPAAGWSPGERTRSERASRVMLLGNLVDSVSLISATYFLFLSHIILHLPNITQQHADRHSQTSE